MRQSKRMLQMAGWVLLCAPLLVPGPVQAGIVGVDMPLVPADAQSNRLAATLTVTFVGVKVSDSDTATLTGNLLANLDLSIDPSTSAVTEVRSIEFTGGLIKMTDMSFTLNFGFLLGKIQANTTGLTGYPSSPNGPGPVAGTSFNTLDHSFVFDQGKVTAAGTGYVGTLFSPINQDLSAEPIVATADAVGTVSVALESIAGDLATYRVKLILPVVFDQQVPVNESVTAGFTGTGTIVATGTFTIPICRLLSDLAGEDCRVDLADLAVFSEQWLALSEEVPCPLSADIAGNDCFVGLDDLLALVAEWLASGQP